MGKRKSKPQPYRSGDCTLGWRGSWAVADFRNEGTGKRQRVRLGELTDAEARAALDRFAESRRAIKQQRQSYNIGQLWCLWLDDRAKDKFSNSIYCANWVSLGPVFAHRSPDLLTADDCRAYADSRFALGRKPWTVHTELSRLRHCLIWAQKRKLIASAPFVWVPSKGASRKRVLTYDEARLLVAAAGDPHILLFILLALTTGARHTAILDLEWDRVDRKLGTIKYDVPVPPDPMSKAWRKGRATVPMGAVVREVLEVAFKGRLTGHVIEHGGRRLKSVRDGFANAVERAGLGHYEPHPTKSDLMVFKTDVTPHVIRHSVATWMRTRGEDFHKIAQMLGHADSKTSELTYTHTDASTYLRGAVDVIDAEFAALPASNSNGTQNAANVSQSGQNGKE